MTKHTSPVGDACAQPLDPARIGSSKDESIIEATLKKHYGTCFTQQEVQFARELVSSLRMPADAPISRASDKPVGEDAVNEAIAALQRLENACDKIAALRTQEQYLSMVDGAQQDALLDLDSARMAARVVLTAANGVIPENCDVRKILLRVVPGDGDGHEVYAKDIADVEQPLGEMGERLETFELSRASVSQAGEAVTDAAISACALMIKGICMTRPQDKWVDAIKDRIHFMLSARAILAASAGQEEDWPKIMTAAQDETGRITLATLQAGDVVTRMVPADRTEAMGGALSTMRNKIAAAPRRQFESAPGIYTNWLDWGSVLDVIDAEIDQVNRDAAKGVK